LAKYQLERQVADVTSQYESINRQRERLEGLVDEQKREIIKLQAQLEDEAVAEQRSSQRRSTRAVGHDDAPLVSESASTSTARISASAAAVDSSSSSSSSDDEARVEISAEWRSSLKVVQ